MISLVGNMYVVETAVFVRHLVRSVCKLLGFVHQLHSLVLGVTQFVSTLPQSHIHPVDYITQSAPCDTLPWLTCSYTQKKKKVCKGTQ